MPTTTTISLEEQTKKQLDEIREIEGHTSQDSVVKTLLLYRELYLQSTANDPPETPTPTRTNSSETLSHQTSKGHTLYTGKIGSGKTFTSKCDIYHTLQEENGNDVIVVDPVESYPDFTERVGGDYVKTDNALGDPFDSPSTAQFNQDDDLFWAANVVAPFIVTVLEDRDVEVSTRDQTQLENTLRKAYYNDESLSLPTLTDPANTDSESTLELQGKILSATTDAETTPLNNHTEFIFPTSDLVTLSPETITSENAATNTMALTLAAFTEAVQRTSDVDLYIDDAHLLFCGEQSRRILRSLLHMGDSYGVNMKFISQTPEEFVRNPSEETPTTLIHKIDTTVLHRVDHINYETRSELMLTDEEINYILQANSGVTDSYSEILVGVDGTWAKSRVDPDDHVKEIIDPESTD